MKYLSIFILFFVLGCSKNGEVGPEGPQGIPGKDGSLIYNGKGIPHISIGKVGDFYLDLLSGNFYGPKSDSGWGTFFNLKGEKGETGGKGESGNQLLSGNGLPALMLGNVGDFYLDKLNMDLFGPKTTSGWGTPVSLATDSDLGIRLIFISPDFHNNYKMLNETTYRGFTKSYEIDLKGVNSHADFYWFNPPKAWNSTAPAVRTWTLMDYNVPIPIIDYSMGQYQYMRNVKMDKSTDSYSKGFTVSFSLEATVDPQSGELFSNPINLIYLVKLIPIKSYEYISKKFDDPDRYYKFSSHRALNAKRN